MQSRLGASFDSQLLRFSVKMFLFAIFCGGYVVGQVDAYGDSDRIVFPGPSSRSSDPDSDETLIPIDLANRLNSIESMDQFLKLLQNVPESETVTLRGRFGEGEERSNAALTAPAACIPELQPVSLRVNAEPTDIIFPSCTRIKRCGGCCSSSLLSCQPTATEIRNFQVVVASVNGMGYRGRQIVPLEEHTHCKCDCKIKEEDCNDKQSYEAQSCTCTCNNVDEKEKCLQNNLKVWNSNNCICSCRTNSMCSSGTYFNHNTCRCELIMSRPINRSTSTKGSNYNFVNHRPVNVPPVIIPLNPSDPRRKHKEDPEYK